MNEAESTLVAVMQCILYHAFIINNDFCPSQYRCPYWMEGTWRLCSTWQGSRYVHIWLEIFCISLAPIFICGCIFKVACVKEGWRWRNLPHGEEAYTGVRGLAYSMHSSRSLKAVNQTQKQQTRIEFMLLLYWFSMCFWKGKYCIEGWECWSVRH